MSQNSVGKFLNESPINLPNLIFNDEAAPEGNELIDDGSDYRNQYYQESFFLVSNVGKPSLEEAGILKGTVAGDVWDLAEAIKEKDYSLENIFKAYETGSTLLGIIKMGGSSAQVLSQVAGLMYSQISSWLIEHVEPVRKAVDSILGNPDMVEAYANSWGKISERLVLVHSEWSKKIESEVNDWTGAAGTAYRKRAEALKLRVATLGGIAYGLQEATGKMKDMVEKCRDAVISYYTGMLGKLAEWTVLLAMTRMAALPIVIGDAIKEQVKNIAKIAILFYRLFTLLNDLIQLAKPLGQALQQLAAEEVATA
ncbi:hypothetical protein ACFVMC_11030 [Nocardia sp. NPDC127579]|uniref:hypothetical protein n=1 Tax=Nocardia sp. NPDC127579 TaxID=3345402 RepID=UPI00364439DB